MKKARSKAAGTTRKRAKPVSFSEEVVEAILDGMCEGESLRAVCRKPGMPSFRSVLRWVEEKPDFAKLYALAVDFRAQFIFDEILAIADGAPARATGDPGTGEATARVQAEKLRIDSRKWLLARMAPKRYGDKITQEISGPDGKAIKTAHEIPQELQDAMLERAAQAAAFAATVQPPASFRGMGSEE